MYSSNYGFFWDWAKPKTCSTSWPIESFGQTSNGNYGRHTLTDKMPWSSTSKRMCIPYIIFWKCQRAEEYLLNIPSKWFDIMNEVRKTKYHQIKKLDFTQLPPASSSVSLNIKRAYLQAARWYNNWKIRYILTLLTMGMKHVNHGGCQLLLNTVYQTTFHTHVLGTLADFQTSVRVYYTLSHVPNFANVVHRPVVKILFSTQIS